MTQRALEQCGRCRCKAPNPEYCWYCLSPMCGDCWEEHGHCGHAEADVIKHAMKGAPYDKRRELVLALIPEEERVDATNSTKL